MFASSRNSGERIPGALGIPKPSFFRYSCTIYLPLPCKSFRPPPAHRRLRRSRFRTVRRPLCLRGGLSRRNRRPSVRDSGRFYIACPLSLSLSASANSGRELGSLRSFAPFLGPSAPLGGPDSPSRVWEGFRAADFRAHGFEAMLCFGSMHRFHFRCIHRAALLHTVPETLRDRWKRVFPPYVAERCICTESASAHRKVCCRAPSRFAACSACPPTSPPVSPLAILLAPPVSQSARLVFPSVYQSACLTVSLSACLSPGLPARFPSACPFRLPVGLSVCPSARLSVIHPVCRPAPSLPADPAAARSQHCLPARLPPISPRTEVRFSKITNPTRFCNTGNGNSEYSSGAWKIGSGIGSRNRK